MESEYTNMISRVAKEKSVVRRNLERWFDLASKPQANFEIASRELMRMATNEPATAVVLHEWLGNKSKTLSPLRKVYLEVFGIKPPTPLKLEALVHLATKDVDPDVRDRALTLLIQPDFSPEYASSLLANALRPENLDLKSSETIKLLNRVAFVMGELGTTNQIMALVNVLEVEGMVVVNPGAGNTNIGNVNGNLSFSPPSKPIERKMKYNSETVLIALKKITGQDFGFNQNLWKAWYLKNFTANDRTFRVDQ